MKDNSNNDDDAMTEIVSQILTHFPNEHNLKQENELLKEYVVRLSKELRKLQQNSEVGPIPFPATQIKNKVDRIEVPQWMLDSSIMSPIFIAYDTRIQELALFVEEQGMLDKLAHQCTSVSIKYFSDALYFELLLFHDMLGACLDKLTKSFRNLATEKKDLRLRPTTQRDHTGANKIAVQSQHQVEQLQKEHDVVLLEQQADLLTEELHNAQQSKLSRDECISNLTDELRTKLDSVELLNRKYLQQDKESRMLEAKLIGCMEQSARYKTLADNLHTRVEDLENVKFNMALEVDGMKISKAELQGCNDDFHNQMIELALSLQEGQQDLVSASSDYDRLNSEHLKQSKEVALVKAELKTAKKTLTRYTLSGEHYDGTLDHWKDKLRSLELERDTVQTKVNALQEQIDITCEREIKLTQILGIESIIQKKNEQHAIEIERKDMILQDFKLQGIEMRVCIETTERKLKNAASIKDILESVLQTERESHAVVDLKQSLYKVNESQCLKHQQLNIALDQISKLTSERDQFSAFFIRLNNEHEEMIKKGVTKQQEMTDIIATLKNTMNTSNEKLHIKIIRCEEHASKAKETARITFFQHEAQITGLKIQVKEKEASLQHMLRSFDQTKIEMTTFTNQHKDDMSKAAQALDRNATKFHIFQGAKETEFKMIMLQHSALLKENVLLNSLLAEQKMARKLTDLSLVRSDGNISSIGKHLSLALKDQTSMVQRERELKLENHSLKMQSHDYHGYTSRPS